jgi:hypothetical protein
LKEKYPDQFQMLLPEGEAKVIAFNTLNQELFDALGNKSIVQVLQDNTHFGLYVGMTSRQLCEEDLRWLTKRGANTEAGKKNGQLNRPVLQRINDDVITMNEARTVFGFQSMEVYTSNCMTNVCDVEDAMQDFLQNEFLDPHQEDKTKRGLKLGRRFWRCVAKGPKKNEKEGYYKTFITFSLNIGEHYGDTIKVVY